jgi:hypothetical protein
MIIMSRLLKNRCWFVVAFLVCAKTCFGQAPSGSFEFTFDSTFDPIINMTGSFQSQQTIIGVGGTETPLTVQVDITNFVTGALKGSGFAFIVVGDPDTGDVLPGAYTASGRVSGGGGNLTRVVLSIQMTGSGTLAGVQNVPFKLSLRYNLIFNSETGTLDGTCRGAISFQNLGSGRIQSDVSVAVPSGSDGSWTMDLTIIPLNVLAGTGKITTSDQRVIPGVLHGVYQPGLGRSVLNLTGSQEGIGMAAHLILLNGETGLELQRATGHVLGQRINFSF